MQQGPATPAQEMKSSEDKLCMQYSTFCLKQVQEPSFELHYYDLIGITSAACRQVCSVPAAVRAAHVELHLHSCSYHI